METRLFICGSAWKSKHKPLFKFTWNLPFFGSFRNPWNLPFQKFLQLNSFATNEICLLGSFSNSFHFATFCHILQRYCNFCSDIFNFCNVIATFFIFATFLHCNYWQNALSSPILFIAFIMQKFYHAIYFTVLIWEIQCSS